MIILDSSNKLQVIFAGAKATNDCTGTVSYVDLVTATGVLTPGISTFTSNGVAAVDILAAPASGHVRLIKSIFMPNADTGSVTATFRANNSGTLSSYIVVTLTSLDNLQYVDGLAWNVLDSSGNLRSVASSIGRLIRAPQILTSASSTYTIPSGCTAIEIEMVGAGGGGGGASGTTASNSAVGGGGAAGGYLRKYIANPQSTAISYTNGSGGNAGSNAGGTGGVGGDAVITINSVVYTAKGGGGGLGMTFGTSLLTALGGNGFVPTNGDINSTGNAGEPGIRLSGTIACSGMGGSSLLGTGGNGLNTEAAGNTGNNYGGGGGGACALGTTARAGGVGGASCIIIREYY